MKNSTKIRLALLEGQFPTISHNKLIKTYDRNIANIVRAMMEHMWKMYLLKGEKATISSEIYMKRIGSATIFNQIIIEFSRAGWLDIYSKHNYSTISLVTKKLLNYVTQEELTHIRAYNKFKAIKLTNEPATKDNLVRINGKSTTMEEGTTRRGFMLAGNTEFQFDTAKMFEHIDVITAEANKGMNKIRLDYIAKGTPMSEDSAMYDKVAESILQDIMYQPSTIYRPGQNECDSRLRDIPGYMNKFFNPVAFKVARALLVIPAHLRNTATEAGVKNIYLAIAEMCNTFKSGNKSAKIRNGREHYFNRTLHNLNYEIEEDRAEAFENIWLERLYDELDAYFKPSFRAKIAMRRYTNNEIKYKDCKQLVEANPTTYKWKVPIEIDMSASVLGYVGALTNHRPFLNRSNMLVDEKLGQAWKFDGLTKLQAKAIMQKIYGSEQSAKDIWKSGKLKYTSDQIKIFNSLLTRGELALGDKFSKFIIHNCQPRPKMKIRIGDDVVAIKCNRFFYTGEDLITYDIYDSETNSIQKIIHSTVIKIANLEAFRRYFVTLLIHNRDGWNEDKTLEEIYMQYGWCLGIHDATILCPEAADTARNIYAKGCETIRNERQSIITNYFQDIGIPASAIQAYKDEVLAFVDP